MFLVEEKLFCFYDFLQHFQYIWISIVFFSFFRFFKIKNPFVCRKIIQLESIHSMRCTYFGSVSLLSVPLWMCAHARSLIRLASALVGWSVCVLLRFGWILTNEKRMHYEQNTCCWLHATHISYLLNKTPNVQRCFDYLHNWTNDA